MFKIGNSKNNMFSKTGKFTSEIHNNAFKINSKKKKYIKPEDFFKYKSYYDDENFEAKTKIHKKKINTRSIQKKNNCKNTASFLSTYRDKINVIKDNIPPLGLYNPKIIENHKGSIIYKKAKTQRNKDKNFNNISYDLNQTSYKIKGFVSLEKQVSRDKKLKIFHTKNEFYNTNITNNNFKIFINFKKQLGHFPKEKLDINKISIHNPNYYYIKKNLNIGVPNFKKYSKRNYLKKELKSKNSLLHNDLVDTINLVEKKNYKLIDMKRMKIKNIKNSKFPIFMQKNINNRNNLHSLNQKMLESNNYENGDFCNLGYKNPYKNQKDKFDDQLDFLNY